MNTENRNPTIVPDINKRVITITDLSQDQDLEKCPSLRVTAGYRACDSLKQLETTAGEAGVDLEIKVQRCCRKIERETGAAMSTSR